MELVELGYSADELSLMKGPLIVSHRDAHLSRALEPGEDVVLLDADGEYHSAHVADLRFDLDDTFYVLQRGVRLPPEQASERLATSGDALEARGLDSTQSVLDLLAELRRQLREI